GDPRNRINLTLYLEIGPILAVLRFSTRRHGAYEHSNVWGGGPAGTLACGAAGPGAGRPYGGGCERGWGATGARDDRHPTVESGDAEPQRRHLFLGNSFGSDFGW